MPQAYLLTWTTYGSWLPGDPRGSVTTVRDGPGPRRRHNAPHTPYDSSMPALNAAARASLRGTIVALDDRQADCLVRQFQETAGARHWRLWAAAIMRNHVHLVVVSNENSDPAAMLRDFKSYGSRALNRQWAKPQSGTWWTESGSRRRLPDGRALRAAVEYVKNQAYPLAIWYAEEGSGG